MNKKLFIIGLLLATTGSMYAARPKPKAISKVTSNSTQQQKPKKSLKEVESSLSGVNRHVEHREIRGRNRMEVMKREARQVNEIFADDYLEKFGAGGLMPGEVYSLAQLKELPCVKEKVVDLSAVEDSKEVLYDFKAALQLLLMKGQGVKTFVETARRCNENAIRDIQRERDAVAKDDERKKDALAKDDERRKDEDSKMKIQQQRINGEKEINDANWTAKGVFWNNFFGVHKFQYAIAGLLIIMFVWYFLDNFYMSKPDLIIATNIKFGWRGEFGFFSKSPEIETREVVYDDESRAKLNELFELIGKSKTNSQFGIPNLIFAGPPGVGKTATAMKIIKDSKCLYAKIDGSKLFQWKEHEAIYEVNKLVKVLKSQKEPVYLIVDEGEGLFGKRVNDKKLARVLAPILSQFGGASGRAAFIIITNLYEELDFAVINRVAKGNIWKFKVPMPAECTNIAEYYLYFYAKKYGMRVDFNLKELDDPKNLQKLKEIYLAMEAQEGKIVGRQIEAMVQKVAVKAYKKRYYKDGKLKDNGVLRLNDFLSLLNKFNDR